MKNNILIGHKALSNIMKAGVIMSNILFNLTVKTNKGVVCKDFTKQDLERIKSELFIKDGDIRKISISKKILQHIKSKTKTAKALSESFLSVNHSLLERCRFKRDVYEYYIKNTIKDEGNILAVIERLLALHQEHYNISIPNTTEDTELSSDVKTIKVSEILRCNLDYSTPNIRINNKTLTIQMLKEYSGDNTQYKRDLLALCTCVSITPDELYFYSNLAPSMMTYSFEQLLLPHDRFTEFIDRCNDLFPSCINADSRLNNLPEDLSSYTKDLYTLHPKENQLKQLFILAILYTIVNEYAPALKQYIKNNIFIINGKLIIPRKVCEYIQRHIGSVYTDVLVTFLDTKKQYKSNIGITRWLV